MANNGNNKFSVVVPAYNRESVIVEALDSVKRQTHRPIEIIIVDDGSTDTTKRTVQAWAEENTEPELLLLKYIYQDNLGAGAARNRGIKEITGDYVQFLDSDDRIHSERLERLVAVFKETNADFIQTGFESFDFYSGETLTKHYGRPKESQIELALEGMLWANTLRSALTISLVEKIGPWDVKMTCFEDREYMERAVVQANNPVAIRDILASARRGGSNRISDRLRSYEGRHFRILCEERLAEGACNRTEISKAAKRAFASRVYALGFRSNASGWPDHGKRCGELASSICVELDSKGKLRRLVWKTGRIGGVVYSLLSKTRRVLGV